MKKNILKIIIIVLLIIIVLTIGLILHLEKGKSSHEESNELGQEQDIPEEDIVISEIYDEKELFKIEKEVNQYFNNIESSEGEVEQNIIGILKIDNTNKFKLNRGYVLKPSSKNTLYFLEGEYLPKDLKNTTTDARIKQKVYYTLTIDNENNTFEIIPYGNEYKEAIEYEDEISDSKIDIETVSNISKEIKKTNYNQIIEDEISDEDLARRYYNDYKENALYFTEEAYSTLDEEYKKERFPTYEEYAKYIEEQKNIIENGILTKYSCDKTGEKTIYTLVDNYQNSYFVILDSSPMLYSIQLDNYTIKTENYEEKYKKMSDEDKVSVNAHIFIQMINTKDFKHAYNLLDNGFKNNYFQTLEAFENYMRNSWFSYNIEAEGDITKEGNNYIYELKLLNSSASTAEKKEVTIIMQLGEGTDFVMSFSVN